MPSWIPYASNWISCKIGRKQILSQSHACWLWDFTSLINQFWILDFSCGTLRERPVQVAQSNDFGLCFTYESFVELTPTGILLRVSVFKSCLGQGMNQKI